MVITVEAAFSQLERWGSPGQSNSAGVSAGPHAADGHPCGANIFISREDRRQQVTWEGLGELSVLQKWATSLCSHGITD